MPGLEFQGWMAGFVPIIYLPKRITRAGDSCPRNFCFYETKDTLSEIFADFHAIVDNFLLSVVIFYYRLKVIVFPILQTSVRFGIKSQNVAYFASFQRNNSVYRQNDRRFKKIINCRKNSYPVNQLQKSQILPILGKITMYLGKRKNGHFKTISHGKS